MDVFTNLFASSVVLPKKSLPSGCVFGVFDVVIGYNVVLLTNNIIAY